jgi:hypothetical protein
MRNINPNKLFKIIIQHTVDSKCSGTVVQNSKNILIEAIPGDAPPLLEGRTTNYESWEYSFTAGKWVKTKAYILGGLTVDLLRPNEIKVIHDYVSLLPGNIYLEWSISKKGNIYFYEYLELPPS